MRFGKLALFIGAVSVVSGGLVVMACGTDNGTTPVPGADASRGSSGSSGTSSGSSGTSGTSGGDDTGAPDAGADCEAAPYLHQPNAADAAFYCPFQDGGSSCFATDTCCSPGIADGGAFGGKYPPSFCAQGKPGTSDQAAADTLCGNASAGQGSEYQAGFFSYSFQCDDSTGCATGQSCLLFTSTYAKTGEHVNLGNDTSTTIPKACNAQKIYQLGGTQCVTRGASDLIDQDHKLVCTKDADCSGVPGTKCVPASVSGRTLGACVAP